MKALRSLSYRAFTEGNTRWPCWFHSVIDAFLSSRNRAMVGGGKVTCKHDIPTGVERSKKKQRRNEASQSAANRPGPPVPEALQPLHCRRSTPAHLTPQRRSSPSTSSMPSGFWHNIQWLHHLREPHNLKVGKCTNTHLRLWRSTCMFGQTHDLVHFGCFLENSRFDQFDRTGFSCFHY